MLYVWWSIICDYMFFLFFLWKWKKSRSKCWQLVIFYIADLPRNICEPGASSRKLNTKDRKEKRKNLTENKKHTKLLFLFFSWNSLVFPRECRVHQFYNLTSTKIVCNVLIFFMKTPSHFSARIVSFSFSSLSSFFFFLFSFLFLIFRCFLCQETKEGCGGWFSLLALKLKWLHFGCMCVNVCGDIWWSENLWLILEQNKNIKKERRNKETSRKAPSCVGVHVEREKNP